jgi:hypothetical protein
VIRVRSTAVQDVRVGNELYVANLEHHVQRQTHAGLLEHSGRFDLCGREGRDLADVAVAGEGFDVVRVPFAVNTRGLVRPCLAVEDGLASVGFLAGGDLALTVEVPDGLRESLCDVGVFLLQDVPDVVDGDDVRLATLKSAGDAEQANDVAVVGVEELAGAGAVDTDLVDLGRVGARVFDVAEDVAQAVLRDEVAEVGAEAHVGDGGLVVAPLLDGEAFEEEEAFAVDDVVAELVEEGAQFGEREFGLRGCVSDGSLGGMLCCSLTYLCDARQGCARCHESIGCVAQLLHLLFGEAVCPFLRVVLVILGLPQRPASDLFWESIVRLELIVVGWCLPAGLDAIGEDVRRRLVIGEERHVNRRVCTSERHIVIRLGSVDRCV